MDRLFSLIVSQMIPEDPRLMTHKPNGVLEFLQKAKAEHVHHLMLSCEIKEGYNYVTVTTPKILLIIFTFIFYFFGKILIIFYTISLI